MAINSYSICPLNNKVVVITAEDIYRALCNLELRNKTADSQNLGRKQEAAENETEAQDELEPTSI